ncbi:MAG: hypothetical protein HOE90_02880 [Bacteriovoracaceae bacterium]|jgi:hypothetical protein|nr:hypothetical protein [Bacteriovoracaceae bacterium]
MKLLVLTILAGLLSFSAFADCTDDWSGCVEGISDPSNAGHAKKAMKACDKDFRKCNRKDKRDCKKQAKKKKKASKKVCKSAFRTSECPIKGKEKRQCKKSARQLKKDCKKGAKSAYKEDKKECKNL